MAFFYLRLGKARGGDCISVKLPLFTIKWGKQYCVRYMCPVYMCPVYMCPVYMCPVYVSGIYVWYMCPVYVSGIYVSCIIPAVYIPYKYKADN